MMMKSHIIISKSLLENTDKNKKFFLDEKNFIYGNIKPDIVSKYKLKKHYMFESYDMVVEKIKFLSSLDLDTLEKYYTKATFSQEIGVICHFLTDFFCVAHSLRWEFKHSMKIHVQYESNLTKVAENYSIINDRIQYLDNFDDFFQKLYNEYRSNGNYEENDLKYSTYMCNTVTNYILDNILNNTVISHTVS
ncbi:zinc dependent phospholipase C family protein [Peptostreptococcus equinus]|uniref:Zinc dependent phospholipase C family protein n=1 Tax=Peptostreptococcus equinus TaxID=3003601 RepID=A0ABY7JLP3_9FIRM|nr:zinc dependent phospholipase C family protein [Peptostreptococcus sp. CBA3647]WAW14000.1 zinc dependent phospholipase C family protein [Peptostreptococcus sp. CBA3647]